MMFYPRRGPETCPVLHDLRRSRVIDTGISATAAASPIAAPTAPKKIVCISASNGVRFRGPRHIPDSPKT